LRFHPFLSCPIPVVSPPVAEINFERRRVIFFVPTHNMWFFSTGARGQSGVGPIHRSLPNSFQLIPLTVRPVLPILLCQSSMVGMGPTLPVFASSFRLPSPIPSTTKTTFVLLLFSLLTAPLRGMIRIFPKQFLPMIPPPDYLNWDTGQNYRSCSSFIHSLTLRGRTSFFSLTTFLF